MSLPRRGTHLQSRERVEWQEPESEGRGQCTLDGSTEGEGHGWPFAGLFPAQFLQGLYLF